MIKIGDTIYATVMPRTGSGVRIQSRGIVDYIYEDGLIGIKLANGYYAYLIETREIRQCRMLLTEKMKRVKSYSYDFSFGF